MKNKIKTYIFSLVKAMRKGNMLRFSVNVKETKPGLIRLLIIEKGIPIAYSEFNHGGESFDTLIVERKLKSNNVKVGIEYKGEVILDSVCATVS